MQEKGCSQNEKRMDNWCRLGKRHKAHNASEYIIKRRNPKQVFSKESSDTSMDGFA